MYYLLLPDLETRSALIQHLKQQGIQSVFHYVPLHTSAMGQNMGYRTGMFPVAESIADRLLRLPFYHDLTTDDIDEVVHHISQFFA
jgi:dTDP-4-amino-4,6-dideoxygalactose transaminase